MQIATYKLPTKTHIHADATVHHENENWFCANVIAGWSVILLIYIMSCTSISVIHLI